MKTHSIPSNDVYTYNKQALDMLQPDHPHYDEIRKHLLEQIKDELSDRYNIESGKVKEYVYQRKSAARRRMLKLLNEQKHEILICTHDNIQHLKPEKYITEHDEDTFHTQ